MKSKKKQRLLALILSMVLMLSASISALAEGDVQTEASGTETTENQAAAQSLEGETVPETEAPAEETGIAPQSEETSTEPVQESTEQEVTETPAESEQEVVEEPVETADTTQVQSTEVQETPAVVEEIPAEEQPEEIVSEATELKQEFTDENGNVTQTVTAYVPEGAFQATADQISMEVSLLNTDDTNYIKGMVEKLIPENYYLDGYVLYQINFMVNGEITEPAKAITISMNGNDLAVEDTQKAHVFYYVPEDPEVEGDEDQLAEVVQKDQLIKSLEESGQSTENIEDYDYSEITVNEGNADTITVKGLKSTIYGCYVEAISQETTFAERVGDTIVKVTAPEGAFPMSAEKVTMTAKALTDEQKEKIKKQLSEQAKEQGQELKDFVAFDIDLWADDEKIQPLVPVAVSFENVGLEPEDEETTAGFQLDEEENSVNQIPGEMTEEGNVEVQAEHFTITGVVVYEGTEKDGSSTSENSNISFMTTDSVESLAEKYLPKSGATNEWQIVNGNYIGQSDAEYKITEDGLFRLQKKVIPTSIENEFYVYLNMEPVMSWKDVFLQSTLWLCGNNKEIPDSDVKGINQDSTLEEVKKIANGQISKLVGTEVELTNENTTQPDKEVKINTIRLEISNGQYEEIPVSMHYGLSQNSFDSFTIIFCAPGSDYAVKLSQVSQANGILTIPYEAWGNIISGEETGDLTLLSGNVTPTTVTDPMGDYIEYLGEVETNNGIVSYNADNHTLTWNGFAPLEETDEENAYGVYEGNYYRRNAYQLVYKIRLMVEENGFNSCAQYIDGENTDDKCIYPTNKTTAVEYSYQDNDNEGQLDTGKDYFLVPEIRGLLYDIEIKKIDQTGSPVSGAEFTLTKTNDSPGGKNIEPSTSGSDGYVKFHNLPWGTYKVTEIKIPDGYTSGDDEDIEVTVCQTTDADKLVQDHITGHNADQDTDIDNMLYKNGDTELTVVNIKEGPGPEPDNPSDIPYSKTIDWLGDNVSNPDTDLDGEEFYRLYLNATGIPDTEPESADIILVLDMSESMKFSMEGQKENVPEAEQRLTYVKSAAQNAVETIKETCEKNGYAGEIRIGIVTFNYGNALHTSNQKYENGTHILSTFTDNYDNLLKKIGGLSTQQLNDRTNYEAAFAATDVLLKQANSKAKQYVVFITDGEANGYTDGENKTGYEGENKWVENATEKYENPEKTSFEERESLNQARAISSKWTELSGFYTIAVSTAVESSNLESLGPGGVSTMNLQANDKDAITEAFNAIVSAITKQVCDVSITDKLTQYVTFVNKDGELPKDSESIAPEDIDLKVTVKRPGKEAEIIPKQNYTATITNDTVTVNFGEDYFLEPQAVYTISFNVKLTDAAYDEYTKDNPLVQGDKETDYPGNNTSSGEWGLYSNQTASVTYSTITDGKLTSYTKEYYKPVVQAEARKNWQMYKKSESSAGDLFLKGAVFTLTSKKDSSVVYTGESSVEDPNTPERELGLILWKDPEGNPVEEKNIAPGSYTLEETKAPVGYVKSDTTWTVTISNTEPPQFTPNKENGQQISAVDTDNDGIYEIVITNKVLYSLPNSGGSGIFLYMIGGTLLLMAGSLMIYINRRRGVLRK